VNTDRTIMVSFCFSTAINSSISSGKKPSGAYLCLFLCVPGFYRVLLIRRR
jgi:hypothetical protein